MPQVTVALCTWNRARLLDLTLATMRELAIPPGLDWELLVVNNHCTDETDEILARHAPHLPLRRLFEPAQGVAFARNLAVREARGEFMVWTDDDVLVDPQWLRLHVEAAQAWPQAGFFGGTVDLWFESPPPAWIARNLERLGPIFSIRSFGPGNRALTPNEIPMGANMSIRAELQKRYLFDTGLGSQRGAPHLRGEETELFERLIHDGHRGVWLGRARVRHNIPPKRLTKQYVWEWYFGWGQYNYRREGPRTDKLLGGVPRWAIKGFYVSRLKAWCLSLIPGDQWLPAYCHAACCQGAMEEARQYKMHDGNHAAWPGGRENRNGTAARLTIPGVDAGDSESHGLRNEDQHCV